MQNNLFIKDSYEPEMETSMLKEQLSKPKPLKVCDGVSRVGIVVDSIRTLKETTKQALDLPQSLCISFKTEENKPIKSRIDFDQLESNTVLTIIPKGPIHFTPENLLKRLTTNSKNLALFSDRDFVTISEIKVEDYESQYSRKRLEHLKRIADEHIAKDQELRDTLDLVQLSKSCNAKDILEKVKKDFGQIFKVSIEELEALASMDDDEMPLVVTQIKAAATRRLRMKRQMSIAKEYLSSNKQGSEKGESFSYQPTQTETFFEYPQAPKNQDEGITENEMILRKQLNFEDRAERDSRHVFMQYSLYYHDHY